MIAILRRLGVVLWWAGVLASATLVYIAHSNELPWDMFHIVFAAIPFLFGCAAHYILAGNEN